MRCSFVGYCGSSLQTGRVPQSRHMRRETKKAPKTGIQRHRSEPGDQTLPFRDNTLLPQKRIVNGGRAGRLSRSLTGTWLFMEKERAPEGALYLLGDSNPCSGMKTQCPNP